MAESLRGIWTLFRVNGGQLRLLSVIVACLPFCSLIVKRQLASQFFTTVRWPARCTDACRGHFDRLRIEVSSATVKSVVRSLVGMSAVYRRYSFGPRTLPLGTPASMTWPWRYSHCTFYSKASFEKIIFKQLMCIWWKECYYFIHRAH